MPGGGIALQEKVARLVSKHQKRPVLKPNRPLYLKDHVANRKPKKGEATCITEMSQMMVCWKQKNFVEALCSDEMKTFYTCVEKAMAAAKTKSDVIDGSQAGRLPPKQATTLLKRYPNIRTEV